MRGFRAALSALVVLLMATSSQAALVRTPWIPANAGVLWWQPDDTTFPLGYPLQPPKQGPGDTGGAWWLTRRVVASPLVPGLMHLGSFFHGLYASAGGGGWATVTPGCWLPVNTPRPLNTSPQADATYKATRRAVIGLTGLDACGIEGIAYDPFVPERMYVSAYDVVSLVGTQSTQGDGGVYESDNFGVTWHKLLGNIRGAALAVARTSPTQQATIVTGYIQQTNFVVGPTPLGNTASVSISRDAGKTWTHVAFPASGCADTPLTSQRLTATIAINPTDASQIYVGTNAGLYTSSDGGATFQATKILCGGGVWGIAVTPDGKTIYVGDKDGVISKASTTTLAFSAVKDLGSDKVQSLILDPRDLTNQTLYAATWSTATSTGSVYRINAATGSATALGDSVFHETVPVDQVWPAGVPKPFPLVYRNSGGGAPSLFLTQSPLDPDALYVSTIIRGVFLRLD